MQTGLKQGSGLNSPYGRGDIAPVSGKEYMASNRETAEITNKIYIRFRSGIKSTLRINTGTGFLKLSPCLEISGAECLPLWRGR